MMAAALALLGLAIVIVTVVQTCLLEAMRLRARSSELQRLFEDQIESRIGQRANTEKRALAFSFWKHSLLVVMGVVTTAAAGLGWEALLWALGTMLVTAYLLPQAIYRRSSGEWLTLIWPLLALLYFLMRPLIALFSALRSIAELTEDEEQMPDEERESEEIEALIEAGAEEGLIEESNRELVRTVLEFGDKTVREVMTPRPAIIAIQEDKSLEDLRQLVINHRFSRIPVYVKSPTDIHGFVHVRDMWEVPEPQRAKRRVKEFVRDIWQVPEQKAAGELVRQMQQTGQNMVIVIDEYGELAGLITIEDLIEEMLGGEIRDEHEPQRDYEEDGQGGYLVSGSYDLDRLEELVGYEPGEDVEATTIGGLATEWAGRVPRKGETIERDGLRIEVLESSDLRVDRVRLTRVEPEKSEDHGEA